MCRVPIELVTYVFVIDALNAEQCWKSTAMKRLELWSSLWVHLSIENQDWPHHSCPKFYSQFQSLFWPQLIHSFVHIIQRVYFRFAMHSTFQWQYANSTHLPGGSQSVAHQFIRCVLHQLAPNGVFVQMFLTQSNGGCAQKICNYD